jgi:hypothetical protein
MLEAAASFKLKIRHGGARNKFFLKNNKTPAHCRDVDGGGRVGACNKKKEKNLDFQDLRICRITATVFENR